MRDKGLNEEQVAAAIRIAAVIPRPLRWCRNRKHNSKGRPDMSTSAENVEKLWKLIRAFTLGC